MTQDKKDEIIKNQDIKKEHVVSLQPITNEGYRKYTANYSYSNSNFVIQNLNGKYQNNIFQPTICVLKNILQRGNPTLMSKFLQDKIGTTYKLFKT